METEGHPGVGRTFDSHGTRKSVDHERQAKQILSQLKIRDFNQKVKFIRWQLKRCFWRIRAYH